MLLRFVSYVRSKRGWPTAPLMLVSAALVVLALLAGCSSPKATPTPPVAASTPIPALSEGADEGLLTYDFSLARIPSGDVVTRESLRAAGKPYILYFFASW